MFGGDGSTCLEAACGLLAVAPRRRAVAAAVVLTEPPLTGVRKRTKPSHELGPAATAVDRLQKAISKVIPISDKSDHLFCTIVSTSTCGKPHDLSDVSMKPFGLATAPRIVRGHMP